ncbi:MAG: hypothetical protein VX069_05070 [Cyanobacteriota bacterium]|nr:hypothetical protein [Cyanobacteriota bacterium]MED5382983.1 hypothetical protein [Cyanobacteriota bacterium]
MKARQLHRLIVPFAAAPLLLTALTGSLYSLLLELDIDAFWLLKIHTGRFGPINLQPVYSILLGILSCLLIASGIALWRPRRSSTR